MRTKTLKLGFIGGALGSAVGNTHKIASQMDSRWQLCSGCFSVESKSNLSTGKSWNIDKDRVYPNLQELLVSEKSRIDAIAILTPTPTHLGITKACLEQGFPVICEKALTTSSKEALEIKETIQKHNGYLAVIYNYSSYPMVREMQNIIKKGTLGKLTHIHIEMPQEGFLRLGHGMTKPRPQEWRLIDQDIPTLSLDLAVHLHHMVDFLTGAKPLEVIAINNNFGFFSDIVDNTMCIARYTDNLDCQIWFGKTSLGHSNGLRVRVFGTKGAVEWYQMNPEDIQICDNMGKRYVIDRGAANIEIANKERYNRFKAGHPAGFIEAFANYYYDLADSLQEFKKNGEHSSPWVFGADVALEGLLMLEAMAKSANSKSWEKVNNA